MKDYKNKILAFFGSERKVFILGFVVALAATLIELLRGRAENYHVFADSTVWFWHGVSPYTHEFIDHAGRYFLYTPVFSVLYGPFSLLPDIVGGVLWNMMNYTLLYLSVMTLPRELAVPKLKIFLYLLLLLEQSIFPFQYNIVVCYIFLFSFTLLEKDKPVLAVLLIMLSATTKIYGVFELGLLFCYKNTFRNFCYAALFGVLFLVSPALKLGFDGLLPYYQEWWAILSEHNTEQTFVSLMHIQPFKPWIHPYAAYYQAGSLAVLFVALILLRNRWREFAFRAKVLGILMGWIILFSEASEHHGYIIAFSGFMLYYYSKAKHSKFEEYAYWINWVLFGIMPIDILCPVPVFRFEHFTLWLDVYFFAATWFYMVYDTISEYSGKKMLPAVSSKG